MKYGLQLQVRLGKPDLRSANPLSPSAVVSYKRKEL
jgi:hypothetical protein